MRHNKKINHLGRNSAHRSAMLANMAASLILHKRITTTVAKAKALRPYIEPMITRSKDDTTHSRRMVFAELQNKFAVTELFRVVAPKVADRPGGYTRIIKLGHRLGDGAELALMELVDFNENLLKEKTARKARSTRRGGKKSAKATAEAPAASEAAPADNAQSTEA
ncbi:MAG: 50S ribosomal protein L17 [Bacteroidetes bacterium]|nr:50S ribosomal protein L17 [Bacteroidota bacterium]